MAQYTSEQEARLFADEFYDRYLHSLADLDQERNEATKVEVTPPPARKRITDEQALKIWLVGMALGLGLFATDIAVAAEFYQVISGLWFTLFDIWLVVALILLSIWAGSHDAFD